MPRFLNDHPATKENDTLRFQRVVGTIERQVQHYMEDYRSAAQAGSAASDFGALALGIEGAWGQGKTSLLRQIAKRFEELDDGHHCVWVSPWKHRDRESIWSALLAEVVNAFPPNVLQEAARHWGDIMGTAVDSVFQFIGAGRPVKELRTLLPTDVTGKERFEESFRRAAMINAKDHPSEAMHPVVVFLDDLDRCEPDVTMEVLEAIKQYLDIPGCVFFAAYDPAKVAPLVGRRFAKDLLAQGSGDHDHHNVGKHYLQKIFTTTITLPRSASRLFESFVRSCLIQAEVNSHEGELLACLTEIANPDGVRNPRRVKKIINRFAFRWHFMQTDGADADAGVETPRADVLMLLATVEECWPEVFHAITDLPESARERLASMLGGEWNATESLRLTDSEQKLLGSYFDRVRRCMDVGAIPDLSAYLVTTLSLAEAMEYAGDDERNNLFREALMRGDVAAVNRLRKERPDYTPSLPAGTKLDEKISLDGVDLSNAILQGCDLEGANLAGANLRGANLAGSSLARACLDRADLSAAKLTDVDFTSATLDQTELRGAEYRSAQLKNTSGTPQRG